MKRVVMALGMMALWLLMSGIYKPMLIGFGVASVALVIWVLARMDKADGDQLHWHLKPLAFIGYVIWLLGEIAKANWAVTRIILSPGLRQRQHLFVVPVTQKTDIAQVIFANSITLTPGTITIETEPGRFTETGRFLAHALNYSEDDPAALADMDRRVSACETGGET